MEGHQSIQKTTDVLIHKGFRQNFRKNSETLRFLIFIRPYRCVWRPSGLWPITVANLVKGDWSSTNEDPNKRTRSITTCPHLIHIQRNENYPYPNRANKTIIKGDGLAPPPIITTKRELWEWKNECIDQTIMLDELVGKGRPGAQNHLLRCMHLHRSYKTFPIFLAGNVLNCAWKLVMARLRRIKRSLMTR